MIVAGPHVGHWVMGRIGGFFDPVCMSAIGWESAGKLVAGASFRDWNGVSIEGQIAADRPLTRGFLFAIFDYPFRQLGARKIVATTSADHIRSIRLLRRLGFVEEACLRDAAPGGDLIIYTMRREACRFLGDHHGQESVRSSGS
jgi:RimJ/RimL family protein N-acetyltransferase